MRGNCLTVGIVAGEACTVRIHPLRPGSEYIGPPIPAAANELFERTLSATVFEVGAPGTADAKRVAVRLCDEWLDEGHDPYLRRLNGGEPPSPFRYDVTARHYLNGSLRNADLREGDACFIWVKAPGGIPGLCRDPSTLPTAFPGYPSRELEGFWKARLVVIPETRGETPVRQVRAILVDTRIRDHGLGRVARLFGHEPWEEYVVTATDDELKEAGIEAAADVMKSAKKLGADASVSIGEMFRRVRDTLEK